MNDHCSKSALLQALQRKKPGPANIKYTDGWNDCLARVRSMISTAKPQTAHWINRAYEPLQCSNCGRRLRLFDEPENYCPRCGYYMKGDN